jgi:hypothetical protein
MKVNRKIARSIMEELADGNVCAPQPLSGCAGILLTATPVKTGVQEVLINTGFPFSRE